MGVTIHTSNMTEISEMASSNFPLSELLINQICRNVLDSDILDLTELYHSHVKLLLTYRKLETLHRNVKLSLAIIIGNCKFIVLS